MKLALDVQRASECYSIPNDNQLTSWVKTALQSEFTRIELTIRIVAIEEMAMLNKTYRHKDGPTNVLSFPFEQPEGASLEIPLLGDIIICADVVEAEAHAQAKSVQAHWAHLVIHGCLHLLGYDHIDQNEAQIMEALEIKYLKKCGYENPYEDEESDNE